MAKRTEIDETAATIDLQPLPMTPAHVKQSWVAGVFRLNESVEYPKYQTNSSGCFDLAADLSTHNSFLKVWDATMGREGQKKIRDDSTGRHILIEPGDRILIPTGLVFVLPENSSMNTFIRSSVGLKKGLMLANGVGYIDEDYRHELFLPIINMSRHQVRVDDKERLAQAEVRPQMQIELEALDARPSLAGNRSGGFGSTGSK